MGTVGGVNCHHGRDAAVRCQCEEIVQLLQTSWIALLYFATTCCTLGNSQLAKLLLVMLNPPCLPACLQLMQLLPTVWSLSRQILLRVPIPLVPL